MYCLRAGQATGNRLRDIGREAITEAAGGTGATVARH